MKDPRDLKDLYLKLAFSASDRRGIYLYPFKDFHLKAKTRFRPCLSCVCHIRSTLARSPFSYFGKAWLKSFPHRLLQEPPAPRDAPYPPCSCPDPDNPPALQNAVGSCTRAPCYNEVGVAGCHHVGRQ